MIKIAINGFGRIGRLTLRHILKNHPEVEVAAINDLGDPKTMAHLLKYDTCYGFYNKKVRLGDGEFFINGSVRERGIKIFTEKDPEKLPWKELDVDVVLECTGVFRDKDGAGKHLKAGAKLVIISAPAKDEDIPSFVIGVNEKEFDPRKHKIIDMGSCTTNCLAPVAKVLNDNFGIEKGFMTTVHSYTNDQNILDLAHKDLRRARAAAENMIPTSTGAANAIGKVIPELKGKLSGMAVRVPTPTVSLLDLVCTVKKPAMAEEINYIFKQESNKDNYKGILGIEDAQLVSSDYKGNSFSAIVDAEYTSVNENLVKVLAWYDNEYAYACRLAEFAKLAGKQM